MRVAVASDAPAISALMEASIRAIFPAYYDPQQIESGVKYNGHLDMRLIEDGTYFVHEADGEIVACGGWSRRNKLFAGRGDADDDDRLLDPAAEPARVRAMFVRGDWTRRGLGRAILDACEDAARAEGFTELVLGATLAGAPLYRAHGFEDVDVLSVEMLDGVHVDVVSMKKAIGPPS
jgi:GNAT superfamily N-acetyltransferase